MDFYSGNYRLQHIGNDGPGWMQLEKAAKDPARFGGPAYVEPMEEGWYRIPAGIEVVFIDSSWDGRGSNQVLQAPWEFRVLGDGNANSLSHYESRLRDSA